MPSRNRIFLPTFTREADFVVARSFAFDGEQMVPGAPFDKSRVRTRKLRQLYDARRIAVVAGTAPPARRSALSAMNRAEAMEVARLTGAPPPGREPAPVQAPAREDRAAVAEPEHREDDPPPPPPPHEEPALVQPPAPPRVKPAAKTKTKPGRRR